MNTWGVLLFTLRSGTVRSNVDPFENFTDERLWEVLTGVGLKQVREECSHQEPVVG